ncbi:hypothetical protein SDC9_117590 [bioreactor metagenome]|uniref:Uncharacterized protein n=1 Tax=bioreactor metagenome TaxID=1076179 RepID=A0A645BZF0_9ZZZZ
MRAHFGTDDVGPPIAEDLASDRHQRPDTQHVRHRTARAEQSGLVAEQFCGARFEFVDRRVLAVNIVADGRRGHRLPHLRGRPGDGVRPQIDHHSHSFQSGTRCGTRRSSLLWLSRSAIMKASSRLWLRFSRGSQAVS